VNLYIHVPFCARRCSYCDFSIAVRRSVPSARFTEAILHEWRGVQGDPGWDESPELDTVYFGGGTPSRLEPAALPALLAGLIAERRLSPGAEVTIEANPDDVTPAAAAAGVPPASRASRSASSRSPPPCSMDAPRARPARALYGTLRAAGFTDLSLDLIYGLPPNCAATGRRTSTRRSPSRPDPLLLRADGRDAHSRLTGPRGRPPR
jgi:oxygen-independent coproporphyrinogen-3 oxidase